MEERDPKTELLVGLFLFVGLLLLGGLILQFGSLREYFKDTYEITVPFPDATGIKEGTPVILGGSRIGKVSRMPKLNEQFNGVIIALEIYHDKKIPQDAKFGIGTAGLIGDAYVEIRPSGRQPASYIEPGTVILPDQVSTGGGLSAMQETANQVGRKVDVVLDDVRAATNELKSALQRVNQGALSDKVLESFQRSMAHLESTMKDVDEGVLADSNKTNLSQAISDLKDATASFKRMAMSVEGEVKKVGGIMDKLEPAVTKFDKAATSADEALQAFKQSGDNLSVFTRDMAKGDGLMKALLLDKELRDDFKQLISNLKRNGVLFYKDDAQKNDSQDSARKAQDQQQPTRKPVFGSGRQ